MNASLSRRNDFSRRNKVGLVIATVLAIIDLALYGADLEVFLTSTLMGVVTIVAVILLWRRGSRAALRGVAASRIVSGAVAIPVFFDGSGPGLVVFAALFVVGTVVAVGLSMARQPEAAVARPRV